MYERDELGVPEDLAVEAMQIYESEKQATEVKWQDLPLHIRLVKIAATAEARLDRAAKARDADVKWHEYMAKIREDGYMYLGQVVNTFRDGSSMELPLVSCDACSAILVEVGSSGRAIHNTNCFGRVPKLQASNGETVIGVEGAKLEEEAAPEAPVSQPLEPWNHEGHAPVQHRDKRPPWCNACGYGPVREVTGHEQYGTPREPYQWEKGDGFCGLQIDHMGHAWEGGECSGVLNGEPVAYVHADIEADVKTLFGVCSQRTVHKPHIWQINSKSSPRYCSGNPSVLDERPADRPVRIKVNESGLTDEEEQQLLVEQMLKAVREDAPTVMWDAKPEFKVEQLPQAHCSMRSSHDPHTFELFLGGELPYPDNRIQYWCDGTPGGHENDPVRVQAPRMMRRAIPTDEEVEAIGEAKTYGSPEPEVGAGAPGADDGALIYFCGSHVPHGEHRGMAGQGTCKGTVPMDGTPLPPVEPTQPLSACLKSSNHPLDHVGPFFQLPSGRACENCGMLVPVRLDEQH